MRSIPAKVTSKGQVTIPVTVRQHLGIERNDKVAFVIEDDGSVRISAPRYRSVASVAGAAGSLKKPLPWREVEKRAREDWLRDKYGSSRA